MMNNTILELNSLYEQFRLLSEMETKDDTYNVHDLFKGEPHKIGCTQEKYPIIFLQTEDNLQTSDIKLDIIYVMFNRDCTIHDINTGYNASCMYTILQLNSYDKDLQLYFLEIVKLIVERLHQKMTVSLLKKEIIKLINLFTNPPQFSLDVVRGLWAELFVIEQSSNPIYLIKSWHSSNKDKYDFNDGRNKIEVKSTGCLERVHSFSIEQLSPNSDSELLIVSVFAIRSGMGKSIFDLVSSISKKVDDSTLLYVRELVLSVLGANLKEVNNIYFDYTLAKDFYQIYDYRVIPRISLSDVPNGVSNVTFRSDLSDCPSESIDMIEPGNMLHLSLFK